MQQVQLTLAALKSLDLGKADEAFQQHLRRAALDCLDRPADETARKVSLEFAVKPVTDDKGNCDEVSVQVKAYSTVPKHQTRVYSLRIHQNGMLSFNPDNPADVNQGTFLSDIDEDTP